MASVTVTIGANYDAALTALASKYAGATDAAAKGKIVEHLFDKSGIPEVKQRIPAIDRESKKRMGQG